MKTTYLIGIGSAWTIRVAVWAGTRQVDYFASTFRAAMRIVDEQHRNTYSPTFYDRDGNELRDNGVCFEYSDGTCL